jgi:hypothetical protein
LNEIICVAAVAVNVNQTSSLATPGGQFTLGKDCVAPTIVPVSYTHLRAHETN